MSKLFSRLKSQLTLTLFLLILIMSNQPVYSQSTFLNVMDSFKKTTDLTKASDQDKIRTMAALCDMSTADFANFAIKRLVIRKAVLEQQVIIKIGTKKIKLYHPHPWVEKLNLPLRYSDFVVDRSGPKFLGALNADVAVETLMAKDKELKELLLKLNAGKEVGDKYETDIVQVSRNLSRARLWMEPVLKNFEIKKADTIPERTGLKYLSLKEAEKEIPIDDLTSIFLQEHLAQRRLSDFDLTARETDTFSKAIGLVLKKLKHLKPSDDLVDTIGRIAWQNGGIIDPDNIKKAIESEKISLKQGENKSASDFYRELVENDNTFFFKGKPSKKFYHVLNDEIGPKVKKYLKGSKPEIDSYYGLGIPFMGPEVEADKNGKLKFQKKLEEIGDIICDETSHYGEVFSHNINISNTLSRMKNPGKAKINKKYNLRDNFNIWLKNKDKAEYKKFKEEEAFIDTILMFEQISKKEAQSQLFKAEKKTGKLIGNVSDTGQFLLGVNKLENRDLYIDVVKLSCIIAMPRWGITKANCVKVDDTAAQITAADFMKSINDRSYCHYVENGKIDPLSPRVNLEWAGIDEGVAKQRLKDYKDGMQSTWQFIQKQTEYFGLVDDLITALKSNSDISGKRTLIRESLAKILSTQLVKLNTRITTLGKLDTFLDSLTEQVVDSARFQLMREAKKK